MTVPSALGADVVHESEPQPVYGDWTIRSPAIKILGGIIVALVVLVAVAGVLGGEQSADSAPQAAVASADSGGGISIVADQSSCIANPYNAKIYFFVALRNDGGSAKDVDLVPVRRYSDGTTNDSVIDTMTATVEPGGQVERFRAEFDYNAEEHSLLECSLRDEDFESTPIVVQ